MSRDISSSVSTGIAQSNVDPYLTAVFEFDSGTSRVWNGVGDLQIGGDTYLGLGDLIDVSNFEETDEIAARNVTLTLSGVPTDLWATALAEPYQNRTCTISLGMAGSTDLTVIFAGIISEMQIMDGADSSTISVVVESNLAKLERPVVRRYTDESQKTRFPNDRAFEFVNSLAETNIILGQPGTKTLTGG